MDSHDSNELEALGIYFRPSRGNYLMQRFMRDLDLQPRQSPLVDFDTLKTKQNGSAVGKKRKGHQITMDEILAKTAAEMLEVQRSTQSKKKKVDATKDAVPKVERSTMWDSKDAEKSMHAALPKVDQSTMWDSGDAEKSFFRPSKTAKNQQSLIATKSQVHERIDIDQNSPTKQTSQPKHHLRKYAALNASTGKSKFPRSDHSQDRNLSNPEEWTSTSESARRMSMPSNAVILEEREQLPSPIVGRGAEAKQSIFESTRISAIMQVKAEHVGQELGNISLFSSQSSKPEASFKHDDNGTKDVNNNDTTLNGENTVIRVKHEDISTFQSMGRESFPFASSSKKAGFTRHEATGTEKPNEATDSFGAENTIEKAKHDDIFACENTGFDSAVTEHTDVVSPIIKRAFKLQIDPNASDNLATYIQNNTGISAPSRAAAIVDKYFPVKKRAAPAAKTSQMPEEPLGSGKEYGMPELLLPRERSARMKSLCEYLVTWNEVRKLNLHEKS